MADPARILIIRPSALGDVCRTVPVLATLRRAWPDADIDWVVQSDFAAAIASHPALTEVVSFPRRDFGRWWRNPATAAALHRWLRELRRRRYDVVYDCQGLGRSGLMTWATRAPRRVGLRSARELAWLGYTVRHPAPRAVHTVEQMMSIPVAEGLEPVYDMRLYLADADRSWWAEHARPADGQPYAVLAPTSRWPAKRWPQPSWTALLGPLAERGLGRVVLVGAPSEHDQVAEIIAKAPPDTIVDLVGRTSIGRLMAVVAGAALVVANDSAPLHMAVGFARPCVGLYGPTDPERVGPWGAADAVVRAARSREAVTHKDPRLGDSLMRRIDPPHVVRQIDLVLSGHKTSRAVGGEAVVEVARHAPGQVR